METNHAAQIVLNSLRTTAELLPFALILCDQDGNIAMSNQEAERLFGYKRRELMDQPIEVLVPQRFRATHPEMRDGFFADPEARRMGAGRDLYGLRKDGSEFPVEIGLNPFETDEGLFVLSVIVDITERKQLEQQFRATVESAPIGMVMIDGQGSIVLVNAETERLFGYERHELMDQPIEVLVPERYRPAHPDKRDGFFADPKARRMGAGRDLYGLRKDGSEFPVEIGLNPIKTDEDLFVLSAIVDNTERKQLEQQFRATVESAPIGMVMIDGQGSIVLVNAETERLFGYKRRELMDQLIEVLVPQRFRETHPEKRAGFFADPEARRMGAGRDLYGLRKDGSEFPVEIGLNPIKTDEGLFVLSAIVDITERKQLEDDLRRANQDLESQNDDLQQFAYVASHDLQEPLRKVASCCQALADDYSDKLDDAGREWISFAIDGATRMRSLIRDLLDYSRIATRGQQPESADSQQAVASALENLSEIINDRGADVTCHPLPKVLADRNQLIQLFQNLIGNGIKYSKSTQPLIEIGAEPRDDVWQFYVKDNGIGIAPEFHERIFQVFQRLHHKDEYPGTGIGLAICKKSVERMGGRLWVESEVGKGSTFFFTLPAASAITIDRNDNVVNYSKSCSSSN